MRKLLGFIDGMSTWIARVVATLSLVTAVMITYEIVVREAFLAPTLWASEATVFACGLLYLLGGSWTLLQGAHVRVDILHARFSPRTKAIVETLTFIPFTLYISVMLWATCKYAWQSVELRESTMSPWNPPIYPMKVAMVVALAMLLLQQTAKVIRDVYFVVKGKQL